MRYRTYRLSGVRRPVLRGRGDEGRRMNRRAEPEDELRAEVHYERGGRTHIDDYDDRFGRALQPGDLHYDELEEDEDYFEESRSDDDDDFRSQRSGRTRRYGNMSRERNDDRYYDEILNERHRRISALQQNRYKGSRTGRDGGYTGSNVRRVKSQF